jgi:hypothetical protein
VDGVLALILAIIVAYLCAVAAAITGTVDALQFPREVWTRAHYRRSTWAWQALGVVCVPVALVYSGAYFLRVRPRLVAAQVSLERTRWSTTPSYAADASGELDQVAGSSVRLRMPVYARVVSLIPALTFVVLQLWVRPAHDPDSTGRAISLTILLIFAAAIFGLNSWLGVTLTPGAAVVHSFRRRHLRWSAVVAVTKQSYFGTRRVLLWTADGQRTALRAPTTAFPGVGRRPFDHDYHVIGRWWLAHRT